MEQNSESKTCLILHRTVILTLIYQNARQQQSVSFLAARRMLLSHIKLNYYRVSIWGTPKAACEEDYCISFWEVKGWGEQLHKQKQRLVIDDSVAPTISQQQPIQSLVYGYISISHGCHQQGSKWYLSSCLTLTLPGVSTAWPLWEKPVNCKIVTSTLKKSSVAVWLN